MRVLGLLLCGGALGLAAPAMAAETTRPGQWETRTAIPDVSMPGAPPGLAEMMKGKPHTSRHCVTPEQAAAGPKELFAKSEGQCQFTRFNMAGGKIDTVMQCKQRQGDTMNGVTKGSYTPTTYTTNTRLEMTGQRGKMVMLSSGTGKWLGPCK